MNSIINEIHYEHVDTVPDDELIRELSLLSQSLFTRKSDLRYFQKLHFKKFPLVILARTLDNTLIACKIGYAFSDDVFYSWFGGVHPTYRRKGIAQCLMDMQHHWCAQHHFTIIRTKTLITNSIMYGVNIHNGFSIIGNDFSNTLKPKLIYSKILTSHSTT